MKSRFISFYGEVHIGALIAVARVIVDGGLLFSNVQVDCEANRNDYRGYKCLDDKG